MKVLIYLPLLLLSISHLASSYRLDQLQSISIGQLQSQPFLEVFASSSHDQLEELNCDYYVIKVVQKQKRHAYVKMVQVFNRVVMLLKKLHVIPDQKSLVKTKIKPQFLTKKRSWAFTTIFAIYGTEEDLDRCYIKLSTMGIERLNTKTSINFLNEKIIALKVFNSAKSRVLKALKRFNDWQITKVEKIDINGGQVANSDLLEQQLEEEFNNSEEVIQEKEINSQKGSELDKQLKMKIVFRVGPKEDETIEQQQESQASDSQESQEESI